MRTTNGGDSGMCDTAGVADKRSPLATLDTLLLVGVVAVVVFVILGAVGAIIGTIVLFFRVAIVVAAAVAVLALWSRFSRR
jgi:hypothetical protein